jgi:hypothetical protein
MREKAKTLQIIVVISTRGAVEIRPVIKILSFDEIDRDPGLKRSFKHVGLEGLFPNGDFKSFNNRLKLVVPIPDDSIKREDESDIEPKLLQSDGKATSHIGQSPTFGKWHDLRRQEQYT